jgi:hypothetical protein
MKIGLAKITINTSAELALHPAAARPAPTGFAWGGPRWRR